ncbi:MAG TPA: DUF928 domain-containing protein [Chroococcales cyanobacterium]
MAQILRFLQKRLRSSVAPHIALSLLLLMPTVALADGSKPDDPPPQTTGTSGGSRGCETQSETSLSSIPALILLAPTQRFGQTVATHPTFAWFIRDSGSWQMEFRIYEYDTTTQQSKLIKEIKDEKFRSLPGIMALSLSSSKLSVGKKYLWQVELVCDSNRPSSNPFAMAAIEVVPVPPELKTKLPQTHDKLGRATLYSQANLWYDILGTVLASADESRLTDMKFSLLEQVAAGAETAVKEQAKVELKNSAVYQLQR